MNCKCNFEYDWLLIIWDFMQSFDIMHNVRVDLTCVMIGQFVYA